MELSVYNTAGKETGAKVNLDEALFGVEPNDHAIYLDVKQFLANQRQGTHKVKDKSEIAKSTRRIVRQKGSGGARHGSRKANIFVGGARTFGPQPRDYSFKINKKVKELARVSALSYKAKNNEIIVLEDFTFETPKTKELASIKKNLNIAGKKTLLVITEPNKNIYLSSRNLECSNVVTVSELNTYSIMNNASLVFTKSSLEVLQNQA
jgi:large subunit ribosomal protein L4